MPCWKPLFNHLKGLAPFAVLSVFLPALDVLLDFNSALGFYQSGDIYWGLMTLLPVFAPMTVNIILVLFDLGKSWWNSHTAKFRYRVKSLPRLFWHIPFVHPIV
jgi:hypothetical protein